MAALSHGLERSIWEVSRRMALGSTSSIDLLLTLEDRRFPVNPKVPQPVPTGGRPSRSLSPPARGPDHPQAPNDKEGRPVAEHAPVQVSEFLEKENDPDRDQCQRERDAALA